MLVAYPKICLVCGQFALVAKNAKVVSISFTCTGEKVLPVTGVSENATTMCGVCGIRGLLVNMHWFSLATMTVIPVPSVGYRCAS